MKCWRDVFRTGFIRADVAPQRDKRWTLFTKIGRTVPLKPFRRISEPCQYRTENSIAKHSEEAPMSLLWIRQ